MDSYIYFFGIKPDLRQTGIAKKLATGHSKKGKKSHKKDNNSVILKDKNSKKKYII